MNLLLCLMIWGWALPSTNPKLAMAHRLSSQGLYQYAVQQLDAVIQKGDADPDVYSYRGHVLSLRGDYQQALEDFRYGMSSDRLAGRDGEAFAYSHFAIGDCSALDLHREIRLFGSVHPAAAVRLYASEVEMARYCGQPNLAINLQSEMAYTFPRAVKTHLALADLALDEGNVDFAWRAMANSQIYFQYLGVLDLYARIALVEQRYEDAFQLLQYIKAQRVSDRSMILKGLATMLAGDPSVLIHKLGQPRWVDNDNPHILWLRLWALAELNDPEFETEYDYFQMRCDGACQQWVIGNLEREIQASLPFTLPVGSL